MTSVEVPDLVDYPEFFNVSDNFEMFKGTYAYVIEPYDLKNGINLYVGFRDDVVVRRMSDFKSEELDLRNPTGDVLQVLQWSEAIVDLMVSIRIADASFYFSKTNGTLGLVDVMIAADKFLGPGMVRDLFDKILPLQTIIEIVVLDEENMVTYKDKLVKPSRFKYTFENSFPRPKYGIIDK